MIRLTIGEADAVRRLVELDETLAVRFSEPASGGVDLSDDEVDLLLDLVTESLARHGFDASYEPTADGAVLEHLIDRLTSEP